MTFREYLAEAKVDKEVDLFEGKDIKGVAKNFVDKLSYLSKLSKDIESELDKVDDRDELYSLIIDEIQNKLHKMVK